MTNALASPTRRHLLLATGFAALAARTQAQGNAFPTQALRIIVPNAPGGTSDTYARILGKAVGEILGQTVVIENKPGAGSVIGTEAVVKARPDGHTLLIGSLPMSTNPGLMAKLPYDVMKDLRPVMHISGQGFIISVGAKTPFKSFAEVVEVARQREFPYATPGIGTVGHLAGQMMNVEYGTRFVHVAYRGSPAAIQDVVGGQVQMIIDPVATTIPAVQANQLRPVAVTNATRFTMLPNTPTLRELGFPAAEALAYSGMMVPSGTPNEVVMRLNAAFNQALKQPEVKQSFERLHVPPIGGTPEAFGLVIRQEMERWVPMIRKLGLKAE